MGPPRRCLLLLLLASVSGLLLLYLGSGPGPLRRPAITPAAREAPGHPSRSLKEDLPALSSASPASTRARPHPPTLEQLTEDNVIDTEINADILRAHKVPQKSVPPRVRGGKRPVSSKSLFSFNDYKPGRNSPPVQHGLASALARLNLEFSDNEDEAVQANTKKVVPAFKTKDARVMEIAGAGVKVGQKVPSESARQILVATTWRSGSTFLGDLINHYPGVFYYFEPLHYYSQLTKEKKEEVQDEVEFLRTLYSCSFTSANVGFLHHVAVPANKFLMKNHNKRLWNSCSNLLPRETMCLMPEYLNRVCPLYPIRLAKTVRLRVARVEPLLQDPSMDLKVVVLVRDPRGVYNSRSSSQVSTWCKKDMCADPAVGCKDLLADVTAAEDLAARYPDSVTLVRYEDLSLMPEETTRDLMDFLDLPWTKTMSNYIDTHTSKEKMRMVRNKVTKKLERRKDTYGTAKNSTATAFAWRQNLGLDRTLEIQGVCEEPMERLGYRLMHSQQDLAMQDLPLDKTAEEVWDL